jgi:nucleoside-diphosphate-sugar epimerase
MFIFGLGYTASRIAQALEARGWEVVSTGRDGTLSFDDEGSVRMALADSSHVLSSVPPGGEGLDPVLDAYGDALAGKWLGYLSSTGVYGDTGGAWVDESAATGTRRRTARAECDGEWLALGARVFRLPGIYGPGRSALDRVREGKAHRIAIPDQVFSRVHVDDIASGVIAALGLTNPPLSGEVAQAERAPEGASSAPWPPPSALRAATSPNGGGSEAPPGAYNLADDLPCSQNLVIEEACRLLGVAPPPLLSLEEANLSPMARAFYAENRRVANGKAKRVLGWAPLYPTYRAGLRAILAES